MVIGFYIRRLLLARQFPCKRIRKKKTQKIRHLARVQRDGRKIVQNRITKPAAGEFKRNNFNIARKKSTRNRI